MTVTSADIEHFTYSTLGTQRPSPMQGGMIAMVKPHPNQDACTLCGRNNCIEFLSTARRRLLYQDMFPRGDSCHGNLRQHIVRGRDDDDIHLLPLDDSSPIYQRLGT